MSFDMGKKYKEYQAANKEAKKSALKKAKSTNPKGFKAAGYRQAYNPKYGMANLSEEDYDRLRKRK